MAIPKDTSENKYISPLLRNDWESAKSFPSPDNANLSRVIVQPSTKIFSPIAGSVRFEDGFVIVSELVPLADKPDFHLEWVFKIIPDSELKFEGTQKAEAFLADQGRLLGITESNGFDFGLIAVSKDGLSKETMNPVSVLEQVMVGFPGETLQPSDENKNHPIGGFNKALDVVKPQDALIVPVDPDAGTIATVSDAKSIQITKKGVIAIVAGVAVTASIIGIAIAVSKKNKKTGRRRR